MAIILSKSNELGSNSGARSISRQSINIFLCKKGISTPLNMNLELYFFQIVSKVLWEDTSWKGSDEPIFLENKC